ncbi:MAG: hypothetical protein O7A63_07825 [Acidobacteria bacterium]|nr:hypothetical protein [Acidobacteriota bacterium]
MRGKYNRRGKEQGGFIRGVRRGGRAAIGVVAIGALFVIFGVWEGTGTWARVLIVSNSARLLTTNFASQSNPAISGDIIVFRDTRMGTPALFYIDLSEDPIVEHQLTDALEGAAEDADIFGRTVVYTRLNPVTGLRDVLAARIGGPHAAAQVRIIAGDPHADQRSPAIGGNLVVWEDDRDGNTEIYARDLLSGIERRLTDTPDIEEADPSVDGCLVVHSQPNPDGTCGIVVTDFHTGVPIPIMHDNPGTCYRRPDLFDRIVVYDGSPRTGNPDIIFYLMDLEEEMVVELPAIQKNARLSGHWLSAEKIPFNPDLPSNVKIYSVPNLFPWELQFSTSDQMENDIDGTRVAYVSNERGNLDVGVWEFAVDKNEPPEVDAGTDQRITCSSPVGTAVELSALGTSDPDGDWLTFTWTGPFPNGCGVMRGMNPTVELPIGRSNIQLTADDTLEPATDSVEVRVVVELEGLAPPLTDLDGAAPSGRGRRGDFRAGSVIPLRLRIACGGTALTGADVAPPRVARLMRGNEAFIPSTPGRGGGLEFREIGDQWVYPLSTADFLPGEYSIIILTPDGEEHSAGLTLR